MPHRALFASLVFLSLQTAACAAMSGAPSQEDTNRAQADARRSCGYSARSIKDAFCAHPPATVPQVYVDNAKSARNSIAPSCASELPELDACIKKLEGHE